MRGILVLAMLACVTLSLAQQRIEWSDTEKLTWDDFKGRPVSSSSAGAISSVGMGIGFERVQPDGMTTIRIRSDFYPKKSWVKDDDRTAETLSHEQLHLDIVEIHSRMLRKCVMDEKFKRRNFKRKLSRLSAKVDTKLDAMQSLYDEETTGPRDMVAQKRWEEDIASRLKALEAYADPDITIKLR